MNELFWRNSASKRAYVTKLLVKFLHSTMRNVNIPVVFVPLRRIWMYALKVKALVYWKWVRVCLWMSMSMLMTFQSTYFIVNLSEWIGSIRGFLSFSKTSPKFITFWKIVFKLEFLCHWSNCNHFKLDIKIKKFQVKIFFKWISKSIPLRRESVRMRCLSATHCLFCISLKPAGIILGFVGVIGSLYTWSMVEYERDSKLFR